MKKLFLSIIILFSLLFSKNESFMMFDDVENSNNHFNSINDSQFNALELESRDYQNINQITDWGVNIEKQNILLININDQFIAYTEYIYNENGGNYDGLIFADVSDSLNPIILSQIEVSGSGIWGSLRLKDNLLFGCFGSSGMDIIDFSDINNPVLINHYDYSLPGDDSQTGRIYDIAFIGDTAFVASRQGGMKILDVSDPYNLIDINTYFSNQYIDAVTIIDNHVLIGDRNGDIKLLDVFTNSINGDPIVSTEINVGSWVWELSAKNNVVDGLLYPPGYVKLNYDQGNLDTVGTINLGDDISSASYAMSRLDDFVFIPADSIYKINSPIENNELSLISSNYEPSLSSYGSEIINNNLYVSSNAGYVIYNQSSDGLFNRVGGNFSYDGSMGSYVIRDSIIFFHDYIVNKINIFSFTPTGVLSPVSSFNAPASIKDIHLYGQNLFILEDGGNILMYDITNIENPVYITNYYSNSFPELSEPSLEDIAFTSEYMIVGFLRYDNNGYYISTIDIVSYDNNQFQYLNGHIINENIFDKLSLVEDKINDKVFLFPVKSINGTDFEAQLREITLNEISEPFFNNISVPMPASSIHAVDNGILYFLSDDKNIYSVDLSDPTIMDTLPVFNGTEINIEYGNSFDVQFPYLAFFGQNIDGDYTNTISIFDLSDEYSLHGFNDYYTSDFSFKQDKLFSSWGSQGLRIHQLMNSILSSLIADTSILDFYTYAGEEQIKSLNVMNNSAESIVISNIYTVGNEFTILNDLPIEISAGSTYEVLVKFDESDYGSYHSILSIETETSLLSVQLKAFVDISEKPNIISISDISNDQGGQVRITFRSSKWDIVDYEKFESVNDPGQFYDGIQSYSIWRHSDNNEWDAVGSFDAINDSIYHFVSPTLCDSTISNGECWSTFRVSAHRIFNMFWISDIDSGYSIDNIAPAVPTNFIASFYQGSLNLSWDAVQDYDFQYYQIDKSADSLFETDQYPSFQVVENSFFDNDFENTDMVYYRVSAIDFSGNKSLFSSVISSATLSNDYYHLPKIFALHQNYPNPFNPTTSISYDLPVNEFVSINVFDLMGREVKTLVNKNQVAGFRSVQWNATNNLGQPVSAGMYIYTIQAGEFRQTRKMVLLK